MPPRTTGTGKTTGYGYTPPGEKPPPSPEENVITTEPWQPPKQTQISKAYEKKANEILNFGMRNLASNEATVSDAAAIILHGKGFARALGDGADKDQRIKNAVDFIYSGADNPYFAIAVTALPLGLQLLRNHSRPASAVKNGKPAREVKVKLPLKKEPVILKTRFSLRQVVKNIRQSLSYRNIMQNNTMPPELLAQAVFTDPEISAALKKAEINVAWKNHQQPAS